MPKISVTGADDFQQEVVFSSRMPANLRKRAFKIVRAVSLQAKANIQTAMPVDTGAARARWGSQNAPGIWIENEAQLSVTQGAALDPYEYIIRLNEGSSQQAPAGFIDVNAERALDELAGDLAEAFVLEFNT